MWLFLLILALLVSVPGFAQTDFSGEWTRVPDEDSALNPDLGDWVGLPLNASALRRAETWDASQWTLPEWQCRPHGGAYFKREPAAPMGEPNWQGYSVAEWQIARGR